MNIIKAKYRDIPYTEAFKCGQPEDLANSAAIKVWDAMRGQPVNLIEGERVEAQDPVHGLTCQGPFYWTENEEFSVCPHIVEIEGQ